MSSIWKNRPLVGISNTNAPRNSRVVYDALDFSADSVISVDLTADLRNGLLDCVQTLWIDNDNAASVVVAICGTAQIIRMPAYTQGYVPVTSAQDFRATVATTAGAGVAVGFGVLSIEIAGKIWATR